MAGERASIRWGILGTAGIATKVCNALRKAPGNEPVAIASRSLERAKDWGNKHGVVRHYGGYAELLDDNEIDAVYIPLPPSMHAEWTMRAAEKGKHVLCEKPLAASHSEAIQMAKACVDAGVQLMDGVMWVHHDRARGMRQVLDDQVLGELRRVTAAFTFRWDEIPKNNIRTSRELAGGALGDLGYYCIRAIQWAFGEEPTQVFATARYYNGVDFSLSAMLWFSDDRMASFDCGFDTVMRQWFEVAGTRNSIVCDDFVLPTRDENARFWVHDGEGASREHQSGHCLQEVRMVERFAGAVRSGRLDDTLPREALRTMKIRDALAESASSGAIVIVNPPGH